MVICGQQAAQQSSKRAAIGRGFEGVGRWTREEHRSGGGAVTAHGVEKEAGWVSGEASRNAARVGEREVGRAQRVGRQPHVGGVAGAGRRSSTGRKNLGGEGSASGARGGGRGARQMCGDEESASDVRGEDEGRASDARETRGVGCARTWETRGARRPRRVGCAGGHEGSASDARGGETDVRRRRGRVGCAGGGRRGAETRSRRGSKNQDGRTQSR